MNKVAIVSCYYQHNYGSMLQAYATQKVLDKLNYINETIDVSGINNEINRSKKIYFLKAAFSSDILLYKAGMVRNLLIKKFLKNEYTENIGLRDEKFDSFKKYFRMSFKCNSKKELGEYCKETYSAVLVGSDQLWLPGNIAGDYYTLNFVPENINTIAYSTSFGQAYLPRESEKKAEIFLKKIRHISVREESGQKLVKKISGRIVPVVCDPTLLLTAKEWEKILVPNTMTNSGYIFCYFLGTNPEHRKFVMKLKKATGYRIIALIHVNEYVKSDEGYADETPYDVGPGEFVNLIRNADYVCTDSFHCTVFALLHRKNFFTLRRYKNTKQSTNNRIDTLFNKLELEEFFLDGNEKVEECLSKHIDYDSVNQKIEILRKYSLSYLKCALSDEGSTDL